MTTPYSQSAVGWQITAPARLHFGLLSFGRTDRRQFGGLGCMLSEPALRLQVTPADEWSYYGPNSERIAVTVNRCRERYAQSGIVLSPHRFDVLSAQRAHLGLGSGTQTALSVAAVLSRIAGQTIDDPATLARLAGRGERSAVGTYGFYSGGLIAEAGKLPGESLGALIAQLPLPPEWRVLLIEPREGSGLSGMIERQAFAALPPVPLAITLRLTDLIMHDILPAVRQVDFPRFAQAIYNYGVTAGECFAAVQGSPFATTELAARVTALCEAGCVGVGQSSWGPLLFAWCDSPCTAHEMAERVATLPAVTGCQVTIATPAKTGAQLAELAAGATE